MKMKKSQLQKLIKEEIQNFKGVLNESQKMTFANNLLERAIDVYLEAAKGDQEQAFGMIVQTIEDKMMSNDSKISLV